MSEELKIINDQIKIGDQQTLYPYVKSELIKNSNYCEDMFQMCNDVTIMHLMSDVSINPRAFQYVWDQLNGIDTNNIIQDLSVDDMVDMICYYNYFLITDVFKNKYEEMVRNNLDRLLIIKRQSDTLSEYKTMIDKLLQCTHNPEWIELLEQSYRSARYISEAITIAKYIMLGGSLIVIAFFGWKKRRLK